MIVSVHINGFEILISFDVRLNENRGFIKLKFHTIISVEVTKVFTFLFVENNVLATASDLGCKMSLQSICHKCLAFHK